MAEHPSLFADPRREALERMHEWQDDALVADYGAALLDDLDVVLSWLDELLICPICRNPEGSING